MLRFIITLSFHRHYDFRISLTILLWYYVGEMICSPKPIKFMDSISNGLDSATTFDIVNAIKSVAESLDYTFVIALLQVYWLFVFRCFLLCSYYSVVWFILIYHLFLLLIPLHCCISSVIINDHHRNALLIIGFFGNFIMTASTRDVQSIWRDHLTERRPDHLSRWDSGIFQFNYMLYYEYSNNHQKGSLLKLHHRTVSYR